MVYFVIGTVLHAWTSSLTAELANKSEFGSRNAGALATEVNKRLLEKLTSHPQFEKLLGHGVFPRSFATSVDPKKTFRTYAASLLSYITLTILFIRMKSDFMKFLEVCRIIPALVFCDAPYSVVLRDAPVPSVLEKNWKLIREDPRSRDLFHTYFFITWPIGKEVPNFLL